MRSLHCAVNCEVSILLPVFPSSHINTEWCICSNGNGSLSYVATNDSRTLLKRKALGKLTPTPLKVWMLRNPSERDNVETFQCHLWVYFTGIAHGWKWYPASFCYWIKANHITHISLYVYICLHAGWGVGIKLEELPDTKTLKKGNPSDLPYLHRDISKFIQRYRHPV